MNEISSANSWPNSALAAEEPPRPFPLVRFFSLTSLVAMILVATLLGWLFFKMQIDSLLHLGEKQNVALTRAFSNTLWPLLQGFLREVDRLGKDELQVHSLLVSLDYTVRHLVTDIDVVKVKLYDPRGMTVYSSQPSQIGQDQVQNPGLQAALRGQVSSELVFRNRFVTFDGVLEDRNLISSYIPLYKDNRVVGVFELYYDVTATIDMINRTLWQVSILIGGAFMLLYGGLFVIVSRAQRFIEAQRNTLLVYLDQIRHSNQVLEERVLERTSKLSLANVALEGEIQERRRTEEELRKLTCAVEQSPVSVIITDLANRIEYVNPKFCQVTGYTLAEVQGRNPRLLKSGRMSDDEYGHMWRDLERKNEWHGEFLNRRKSGELFWEHASISLIRDAEGIPTHYLAIKEDITERKLAAELIHRNELRLRTIMENVVEGIITTDRTGIIESVNPSVEKMFGFSAQQLVGNNIRMLVPDPHAARHDGYIRHYLEWFEKNVKRQVTVPIRGEVFFEREVESRRANGEKFPLELTVSHVSLEDRSQFIATMRDISERKKNQAEMELARQKSFMHEKMAAMGTLAAGIMHEIGNPIAAISGLVEVLFDDLEDAQSRREHLHLIEQQINRLLGIIREVAEFSQPQTDGRQLVDLNGLVAATLRIMRFDRRVRHRVESRMELDPNLPAVPGLEDQLRQVLINLIINAADALIMGEVAAPYILVRSAMREGRVWVEVEDNGPGMDAFTRQHAFDAFFTTKPVGKGTGLGLSLCFNIIAEHGGEMCIDSQPGQGTRVGFCLPGESGESDRGYPVADSGGG
ncbi:MAG: PAS domain S-box protein [Magnetococcales bacterium]|nr:PAS domain S-box protein [Magnetococcales bacterium]